MVSIKRISLTTLGAIAASVLVCTPAFIVRPESAYAEKVSDSEESKEDNKLTPEQSDAIVQNCGNIKQSLIKLQHSDSRTRTYLGTAYEAINGRFITPLNLRLVKNGVPSTKLFEIQNQFTAAQSDFRDSYVDYMRELENLIAIDCVLHPQDFYNMLTSVRNKRSELRGTTEKLSELSTKQYQAVEELRTSL